jgi:lipopolysaccharide export system permease protein
MTVVHRYIAATFMKYFAMVLVMVVLIYLAIDFFSRIDRFLSSPVSGFDIFLYFAYKMPLIISQIAPIGVLLAALIVFGLMSRNNEIIALKSGGVSVFYLLKPVAVIGALFTVALFLFSEVAVPVTIARSNEIDAQRRGERRSAAPSGQDIWIRHADGIAHARYFHPREPVVFGISLYFLDDNNRMTRRIDARRGEYVDGAWVLYESMIQYLERDKGLRTEYKETLNLELALEPSDFQRVVLQSQEMSFLSLYRYIQRVQREGYDPTKYRVDFYGKTAFPFVCLIMAVMGSAIALRGKTKDVMATGFAYGIILAFAYWSIYSFSLSMGYGGLMPAPLAAWTANILYGLGVSLLLLYLE